MDFFIRVGASKWARVRLEFVLELNDRKIVGARGGVLASVLHGLKIQGERERVANLASTTRYKALLPMARADI